MPIVNRSKKESSGQSCCRNYSIFGIIECLHFYHYRMFYMPNPNTILSLPTNFRFVEKATRKSSPTQNLFRGKLQVTAQRKRVPFIPALERHSRRHILEVWGQPGLQCEFLDSQSYTFRPCLKKERDEEEQGETCRMKKEGRGGGRENTVPNYPNSAHPQKQDLSLEFNGGVKISPHAKTHLNYTVDEGKL